MSWASWGLLPIPDNAPPDAVLTSGGRLVVLGADEFQYVEDKLSSRWLITAVVISKPLVELRRDDLVIWRLVPREDPSNWSYWGGPSRVLTISDGDTPGQVECCLLEDATLESPDDGFDLTDLLDPTLSVGSDGLVLDAHRWRALEGWGLTPRCPRCVSPSRGIAYGLTDTTGSGGGDQIGGCVLGADQPQHVCVACQYRF